MKGIINDLKRLVTALKAYKTEHNQSFWNQKKLLHVIVTSLRKNWLLILLGIFTLLTAFIVSLNNVFDEKLYVSLAVVFIILVYIGINLIITVFQSINDTYYKNLKIDRILVKRISRLGIFIVSIIFIIGIGGTELWFVENYVNPPLQTNNDYRNGRNGETQGASYEVPLKSYSYYDEYGNFLLGGVEIENEVVTRDQSGKLETLSFNVKNDHIIKKYRLNYEDEQITQIQIREDYDVNNQGNYGMRYPSNNQEYGLMIKYSHLEKTINFQYNTDSFIQTQTTDYIINEQGVEQVIYSETETQEFVQKMNGSKNQIVLNKNTTMYSLYGTEETVTDLYNNNMIDFKIGEHCMFTSSDNLDFCSDENDLNYVTEVMDAYNTKKHHDFDLEIYKNDQDELIIDTNNGEIKSFNTKNNLSTTKVEHLDTDFGHDLIIHANTEYEGNYKVHEYSNHYWWFPEDTRIREYKYVPTFKTQGIIDYIDMFENDQHVVRYLFEKTSYGYKVSHYSYTRDEQHKYTQFDGNNNLFSGAHLSSAATPMSIIRDKELYTNALIKQELPYLYLLEE